MQRIETKVEYRNRKIKDPEYVKEKRRKARERYKRLSSNPEWREKRNAYNREWQKENREKKEINHLING